MRDRRLRPKVRIRCDADVPADVRQKLMREDVVYSPEVRSLAIYDVDVARLNDVWKRLDQYGVAMHDPPIFAFEIVDTRDPTRELDWYRSSDDWLGLVLKCDGNTGDRPQNPDTDFDPAFGFPCQGFLKRDVPVLLDKKPTNCIFYLCNDSIYNQRFLDCICLEGCTRFGEIRYRGQVILNWCRVQINEFSNVIHPDSVGPIRNCA